MPPAVSKSLFGGSGLPPTPYSSSTTRIFSESASADRFTSASVRNSTTLDLFDGLDIDDDYYMDLGLNKNILVAILLGTIMVFTIVGNLMVIYAIFNYRPLHIVQNMYLVSLAVADIAVAVLVMPFNVVYNLLDKWIFGLHLCEMWLTSDV